MDPFSSLPPVPSRPYLRIDLATVRRNVAALRGALPTAEIRYAVKANPAEPVLQLLAGLDCTFDVASVGEIDLCAAAGVDGALMTFGNPLKKPAEIAYAFARGVRRFTFDTAAGKWEQRKPAASPSPRAGHALLWLPRAKKSGSPIAS